MLTKPLSPEESSEGEKPTKELWSVSLEMCLHAANSRNESDLNIEILGGGKKAIIRSDQSVTALSPPRVVSQFIASPL